MLKEFKEFAVKGNVVDMAVGVIIGGAFGKIVASFPKDVVMPPIGLLMGGVDFSDLKWVIKDGAGAAEAVSINYGAFVTNVIDFAIVSFVIFMAIKGMNSLKRVEPENPAPAPIDKKCSECALTIPIEARRCGHCTSVVA